MPSLFDVLSGIGTVLDTPGAMVRTALAGDNPFSAILNTDERVSGRELLKRYGLADDNEDQGWIPDAGDLGGFAVETLLDPANLLGGYGLAKRLMGASKAKAANRAIRNIPTSLPNHGWVHGAPESSLSEYLKNGIPITDSEEGMATFLGRLDHPTGYQGSMTSVGGFGPRTKLSQRIEGNTAGLGRERFDDDRIAYVLSPDIPAIKRGSLDWLDMVVNEHPKMIDAWNKSGSILRHTDRDAVLQEIRPELLAKIKSSQNLAMSKSHRVDHEAIVVKALADKAATPEQITALISDRQLPAIFAAMKVANRQLPVYDPLGHLRLRPKELSTPSSLQLLASLTGMNAASRNHNDYGDE